MAVAPSAVRLVETEEDVDSLARAQINGSLDAEDPPMALLAQTTLSHDEWAGIVAKAKDRFPDLWMPGRSDLCFATTNRQAALKVVAARADAVVVIGSANSSNTVALAKVASAAGCAMVLRVNDASELPDDLSGTVGVTAGASAPEALVQAVLDRLNPSAGVEEVRVTVEEEYFPPPPELRDLLRALSAAVGFLAGSPGPCGPEEGILMGDRLVSAAAVLDQLAS